LLSEPTQMIIIIIICNLLFSWRRQGHEICEIRARGKYGFLQKVVTLIKEFTSVYRKIQSLRQYCTAA